MRIKKTSQTTPVQAEVVNTYSTSQENTYSCDYINNSDSYSTSEVKTNKRWIDGKPIYRKVITFTVNNAPTAWVSVAHNISNLDKNGASHIASVWVNTDSGHGGNQVVPNSAFQVGLTTSNVLYVNSESGSGFDGKTCTVIIEYTKTTD